MHESETRESITSVIRLSDPLNPMPVSATRL